MAKYHYQYGVIPTNGRHCFRQAAEALRWQVDDLIVVEAGPDARYIDTQGYGLGLDVSVVREPDLNISKWWNLGITLAAGKAEEVEAKTWDVVIINDDVIVPDGWVRSVSKTMREMKVAAACSGGRGPIPVLHTQPGPVDLMTRMQGFAFILAGEKGVRADEQLVWWFGDDHIDWCSRKLGGMVMIPGYHVEHLYPNGQMTPELHAQTAKDAAAFKAYWRVMPW